ncbi:MAG: hypothetical protein AB7O67_16720 [Vicinamibacterales bacterium]
MTKPCERAPRGCRELVEATGPKTLARKRYCSSRCAYLARVEAGTWHAPNLTREQRQRGGRAAGRASGESRRAAALERAVAAVDPLLTPSLRRRMTGEEIRSFKVLLARAWWLGRESRNPRSSVGAGA